MARHSIWFSSQMWDYYSITGAGSSLEPKLCETADENVRLRIPFVTHCEVLGPVYICIYKTDLKVGEKKPMETVQLDTTQNLSPVLRCSAVNSAYWWKTNIQGLFYVCTVCIWHCEHTRFCVEVFFMCYINFHSFIHSIWFNSISNAAHLSQAEYGHEGRGGMGMGGGQVQSAEPCQPWRQMEGGSTNT